MTSRTVSITIQCLPAQLHFFITNAENLPQWAQTFCRSVRKSQAGWVMDTPQGPVQVRFAASNDLGVADHYLTLASGEEVLVPMRVVPNGAGSELIFTVFQYPHISDDGFTRDIALVEQDLRRLKTLMERAE